MTLRDFTEELVKCPVREPSDECSIVTSRHESTGTRRRDANVGCKFGHTISHTLSHHDDDAAQERSTQRPRPLKDGRWFAYNRRDARYDLLRTENTFGGRALPIDGKPVGWLVCLAHESMKGLAPVARVGETG